MKPRNVTLALMLAATIVTGCASTPQQYDAATTHCGPDYGGAAIGALAGGVLGAQVGQGYGRDAAIATGAATGAVIGSRMNCP